MLFLLKIFSAIIDMAKPNTTILASINPEVNTFLIGDKSFNYLRPKVLAIIMVK